MLIGVLLIAGLVGAIGGLGVFRMQIASSRSYLLSDKKMTQAYDLHTLVLSQTRSAAAVPPHAIQYAPYRTHFVYEAQENAFEPQFVQAVTQFEAQLFNRTDVLQFCVATAEQECFETAYTFSRFPNIFRYLNLSSQIEIEGAAFHATHTPWQLALTGKELTPTHLATRYARSILTFAAPLPSFNSPEDRQSEQHSLFVKFLYGLSDLISKQPFAIFLSNQLLLQQEINRVANGDIVYTALAGLLVLIYSAIHLRSPLLALFGMLQTGLAFPLAYFFFRLVFQISFYTTLHNLSVFVILGVAADDMFVFAEAWRQAEDEKNLELRMAKAYKSSCKALLVTSFTTAAAFLATGFSEIMPISSFGYFAALLILANYLLAVTLFPAAVVLFRKCAIPRFSCEWRFGRQGMIGRCCGECYFRVLRKLALPMLLILTGWLVGACYLVSQLEVLSSQEQVLRDDNPVQRGFSLLDTRFHPSNQDAFLKVTLLFGAEGLDRSQVSMWDVDYLGKVRWDDAFSPPDSNEQAFLAKYCADLRKLEGHVLNASDSGEGEVSCFIQGLEEWSVSEGLAWPPADFSQRLKDYAADSASLPYRSAFGFQQGQLRYISIEATSSLPFNSPASRKAPQIEFWEQEMRKFNSRATLIGSGSLGRGQMSGGLGFAWADTERALIRGAIQGMVLAGVLAFAVLLGSTLNIVVALLAVLSISGIMLSVMGLMSALEWEVGMGEAIAMVMLIGFSVDYVVHLANHYSHSSLYSRRLRVKSSLQGMGSSILGAAITTLLVGVVLFATQFLVFNKFAILITASTLFSLLFAFCFFVPALYLFGPEGHCGSLNCCCRVSLQHKEQKPPRASPSPPRSAKISLSRDNHISLAHNSFHRSAVKQNPEYVSERLSEAAADIPNGEDETFSEAAQYTLQN